MTEAAGAGFSIIGAPSMEEMTGGWSVRHGADGGIPEKSHAHTGAADLLKRDRMSLS